MANEELRQKMLRRQSLNREGNFRDCGLFVQRSEDYEYLNDFLGNVSDVSIREAIFGSNSSASLISALRTANIMTADIERACEAALDEAADIVASYCFPPELVSLSDDYKLAIYLFFFSKSLPLQGLFSDLLTSEGQLPSSSLSDIGPYLKIFMKALSELQRIRGPSSISACYYRCKSISNPTLLDKIQSYVTSFPDGSNVIFRSFVQFENGTYSGDTANEDVIFQLQTFEGVDCNIFGFLEQPLLVAIPPTTYKICKKSLRGKSVVLIVEQIKNHSVKYLRDCSLSPDDINQATSSAATVAVCAEGSNAPMPIFCTASGCKARVVFSTLFCGFHSKANAAAATSSQSNSNSVATIKPMSFVSNSKKCQHENCNKFTIQGSDFCDKHSPKEETAAIPGSSLASSSSAKYPSLQFNNVSSFYSQRIACSHPGCVAAAITTKKYCSDHLKALEVPKVASAEYITPSTSSYGYSSSRRCTFSGCSNFAIAGNSQYCLTHRHVEELQLFELNVEKEDLPQPPGSVRLYPIASNIFVDIIRKDIEGTVSDCLGVWMGTYPVELYLSFLDGLRETCPPNCDFECHSFCILDSDCFDHKDIINGSFSHHPTAPNSGSKALLSVPLQDFTVQLRDNVASPPFVDLGANVVDLKFVYRDADVSDRSFIGKFSLEKNAPEAIKSYAVKAKSNKIGSVTLGLPREGGMLQGAISVTHDMTIPVTHTTPIREDLFINPLELPPAPRQIKSIVDSKLVASLSVAHKHERPIVVLGDISGSMSEDDKMDCLRTSLLGFYLSAVHSGTPIALIGWNDTVCVCPDSPGARPTPARYMTSSDLAAVEGWIKHIEPDNATYMQQAIESAIDLFPTARDIHIVCDGDITPFYVASKNGAIVSGLGNDCTTCWRTFREQYSQINFHFVALSSGAQYEAMEKMACIGRGDFTVANRI